MSFAPAAEKNFTCIVKDLLSSKRSHKSVVTTMPEDNLARIEDTVDRVRAVVVIGGSFVVAHYVFSDFAEFGNLIVASIAGLIGFGVTFGCLARFLKLKRT